MHPLRDLIDVLDIAHPITFTVVFLPASWLMIWRLESLLHRGLEGTALGTLVVSYCSQFGKSRLRFSPVARQWTTARDHGEQRHQPHPTVRIACADLATAGRFSQR